MPVWGFVKRQPTGFGLATLLICFWWLLADNHYITSGIALGTIGFILGMFGQFAVEKIVESEREAEAKRRPW